MSVEAYRPRVELSPTFNVRDVEVPEFRGPCGGVNMAIETTFETLGIVAGREPVYANNDPVHNKLVSSEFKKSGLIIESQIKDIPNGSILIASAHGWPPAQQELAQTKELLVIDTTCQLVDTVGRAAERAIANNRYVVYFGAGDHPEPKGILGRLPEGSYSFIDVREPSKNITQEIRDYYQKVDTDIFSNPLVVLNQTTLSTVGILEKIKEVKDVNPDIEIPNPEKGICYATDNRQKALRERLLGKQAKPISGLIVVGSATSHNSQELRNVGEEAEIPSYLIDTPADIKPEWLTPDLQRIVVTSGASVLDVYLEDVLKYFTDRDAKLKYPISAEKVMRKDHITGKEELVQRFFVAPDLTQLWERYQAA